MIKIEDKICGSVERIVFKNSETGYHVLRVLDSNTDSEHTITVNHLNIGEGVSYEFEGSWVVNTKFGTQFKAVKVVEMEPTNSYAMVKYLSSRFFKGIGPVMAQKIVDKFGDDTYDILSNNIDKLMQVPGVSKKKLDVIKESWKTNNEINQIMLFLQKYDISVLFSVKIYEFFGNDCIDQILSNPYRLIEIDGVGFKSSDKVALNIGFAKDHPLRISAGIQFVLSESENSEGHCFLYHEQIIEKARELLGVSVRDEIDDILNVLIKNNEIKLFVINDEKRYYSNFLYYAERSVVNRISVLKNTPGARIPDNKIELWEKSIENSSIKLSDEQKSAIKGIVKEKVSILTGGAGVGKTTTLNALLSLLEMCNIEFKLTSPTGRAAQRMQECTGHQAQTIHRLLQWDFVTMGFIHNEKNQLTTDFLILDESSMVGVELFACLLKTLPPQTKVLMIGDAEQIPPVQPGRVFADFIESGVIKTFMLTQIFRQSEGSDIIKFSYDIRNGHSPQIKSPFERPYLWTNNSSCMFIDSDFADEGKTKNDYPDYSTLHYDVDIVEMIRKLYCETIPKYHPNKEIQILIPQNIGELGTIKINKIIQESVNPKFPDKPEIQIGDICLRRGDRCIVTKNSYEHGIFNGDICRILDIDPSEKKCVIELGYENKVVELQRDGLLLLKLGYAISIHKAQGSEFDITILPVAMNFYRMLYRQLFYTGITRAKTLAVCIGSRRALAIAVNNVDQSKRQTSIIDLFKISN